jgi:hypothetical protein
MFFNSLPTRTFVSRLSYKDEPRKVETPNDRRQCVEERGHQWRILLVGNADCARDEQHRTRNRPSEQHLIVRELLVFVLSQQEAEVNADGVDGESINRQNVEVVGSVVELTDAGKEEQSWNLSRIFQATHSIPKRM